MRIDLAALKRTIDEASRAQGAWTVRDLRNALTMLPDTMPILLENGHAPANLTSYRGSYDRLAITGPDKFTDPARPGRLIPPAGEGSDMSEYGLGWYQPGSPAVEIGQLCTASVLVEALQLATGARFEGYKGGQYTMNEHTVVHVAEWGDCGPVVSGLRPTESGVVIVTTEEEW